MAYNHTLLIQPDHKVVCCHIVSAATWIKTCRRMRLCIWSTGWSYLCCWHSSCCKQYQFRCTSCKQHHSDVAQDDSLPTRNGYKDIFPDELLAELLPARNVYHTIPLTHEGAPPPRKNYHLSKSEMAEHNSQVKSLLAKDYVQPISSPYGHSVRMWARAGGKKKTFSPLFGVYFSSLLQ